MKISLKLKLIARFYGGQFSISVNNLFCDTTPADFWRDRKRFRIDPLLENIKGELIARQSHEFYIIFRRQHFQFFKASKKVCQTAEAKNKPTKSKLRF